MPATPNCEADEVDGRVFIKALRDIAPGEELFYDYGLVIDERYTPKLKKRVRLPLRQPPAAAARCWRPRGADAPSRRRWPTAAHLHWGAEALWQAARARCCRA